MPITAAQLLYADVEKDRSPHKRSGFQTLFYSHSRLSEAEKQINISFREKRFLNGRLLAAMQPTLWHIKALAPNPSGIGNFASGP